MATRILVPLDGSSLSEQALPCAVMLARGLGATVVLFRAVSLPSDVTDTLEDNSAQAEIPSAPIASEAHEYLNEIVSRLQDSGLAFERAVVCGPAADAILDYVDQEAVDQIVMATHGYSGISRWMHGSVAERIVQSAKVPVLLVRAHGQVDEGQVKPMTCRCILVPLDGSPIAEQVLGPVTDVAKALGAELILFRVLNLFSPMSLSGEWHMPLDSVIRMARQEAESYLERVAARLRAQEVKVSTAIQVGGVANAIIDYAIENQVDLIAMCTHGRTGLARWALGSVADRVLRAGEFPLYLVRAR